MAKRKQTSDRHSHKFLLICESKRPFKTEELALEAADFGMLDHMTLDLGVYQCDICNNWHLTRVESIS